MLYTGWSTKEKISLFLSRSTQNFWRVNMSKQKWKNQKQKTMHFENVIYSVLRERSNITASFAKHLKFQEKMTSTHSLWVNSGKSKEKQLELGHCMFWNCYIKGAPRTEQYHISFPGAPKISRKIDFYTFT